VITTTGTDGQHYYFKHPGGHIRTGAAVFGPGVDVRGDGGYIVAPPSIHPNGNIYTWKSPPDGNGSIAVAPEFLVTTLTQPKPQKQETAETLYPIPDGERNATLASLAGTMRNRGMSQKAIEAALLEENKNCDPPLEETEVTGIAKSVSRYKPAPTGRLGTKLPKTRADRIAKYDLSCPDLDLRRQITRCLLGKGMDPKPSSLERRELAGKSLLAWLDENGGFLQAEETEALYYFHRGSRRLYNLESDLWACWLYTLTGANPAGTDYSYLHADCRTAALQASKQRVVRVAAWDSQTRVLRVSRFDGTVFVLDGETIQEESNGDNALFIDDPDCKPYSPDFTTEGFLRFQTDGIPHWSTNNDDRLNRMYGLAYRAWIVSTFFPELCPTKPLLCLQGEKGSGKSMLLRSMLQLFFGPLSNLSGVPEKADGFTAAASSSHILILDNLDDFVPWIRDKLARLSTGAVDEYRKLYTSNELGRVRYRCWLGFTARTPDTLRRDDLADRLLLLPLSRIEEGRRAEREFLDEVHDQRNIWWGDLLKTLNNVVAAIRRDELPEGSKLRMADWESLGRLFACTEDNEDLWEEFICSLKQGQAGFLLDENPIYEALQIWLSDKANHGKAIYTRDLYTELTFALYGADGRPTMEWPKSAPVFGRRLSEIRRDLSQRMRIEWHETGGRKLMYQFWPEKAV